MRVHAETPLTPSEIQARLGGVPLRYEAARTPPKLFMPSPLPVPPAAAEVILHERPEGSEVELRLMWGPLPAPFPRALVGVGVLAALGLLAFLGPSPITGGAALLLAVLPVVLLQLQRGGERVLQDFLGRALGDVTFAPRSP